MKLISGSSNQDLAKIISQKLKIEMIDIDISKFANDEKRIIIKKELHGEDICLVQSFSTPVDENIIELLLITDALERMGAKDISLVLPWMGYSLQDKVFNNNSPVSAKVVANLISNSYIKRVYLLDLHNTSIPGFFSIPVYHLSAINLFIDYSKKTLDLNNSIVVSPDFGGLKRARDFAQKLNLNLININKHRDPKTNKVTPLSITGNVKDKICLIFDDVLNTGGTVYETAKFLKNKGATKVHFLITHGIFAQDSIKLLNNKYIDSIVVTNSITQSKKSNNNKVIDCSPIFIDKLKKWL